MQQVKKLYFILASLIAVLILLKSFDYFLPNFASGFLFGKQAIFPFYKFFLYAHIIAAPITLFTGLYQFSKRRSKFHRIIGKVYVASVLLMAAPGAFLMSFYAIGGLPSKLSFLLLSFLWMYFTFKAFLAIKIGDVEKHQSMMIKSFILTNSAIGIRVLSYVNNQLTIVEPELGYVIISWLSWLPALLIYELIHRNRKLSPN